MWGQSQNSRWLDQWDVVMGAAQNSGEVMIKSKPVCAISDVNGSISARGHIRSTSIQISILYLPNETMRNWLYCNIHSQPLWRSRVVHY